MTVQLAQFLAHAELQRALERHLVAQRPAQLDLTMNLFVAEIEHGHQRRRPELLAGRHNPVEAARFPEGAKKLPVRVARAPERRPLGENKGTGLKRQPNQKNEDAVSTRSVTATIL